MGLSVKIKYKWWLNRLKSYALIYMVSLFAVLYVTGVTMKLLRTELLVNEVKQSGINYDAFRDVKVSGKVLNKASKHITHMIRQYPELKNCNYIDTIGYLTFSMMVGEYNPVDYGLVDEMTFRRGISKAAGTEGFKELYECYKAILTDLKYFPVPRVTSGNADISYIDSWNDLRTYGGNRRHEGTDLMASNNIRGFFPVISITDGVVEKMGWLEQGGYRIGVRAKSGGYFYYAHLNTYAPELKAGDKVIAGQLLGFMGDSGYGSEGTIGQFDVHLHLGIYVQTEIGEISVNPYWILIILEDYRTEYAND